MRRREFIVIAGCAWASLSLPARSQQTLPVLGFLHSGLAKPNASLSKAFGSGLAEAGYVDGKNVAIEYRWAEGRYDELPALAGDLVRRQVGVIFCAGPPAAVAAKSATTTIPIVFVSGSDPIGSGLVASLNHPGGNVTGVALFTGQLGAKQLGLLRELLPKVVVVALLVNPNRPLTDQVVKEMQAAAVLTGHQLRVVKATDEASIDKAFEAIAELQAGALIVGTDPYFFARNDQIVALAARYAVPAFYEVRENAENGGLISYGASITDGYRRAGIYAGQILKGAKPADLPVVQPTKFELVINLKTAKTLGLTLSPGLLAIADEVIE